MSNVPVAATLARTLAPERLKALEEASLAATPERVERALGARQVGLDDFLALISPAGAAYLEPLAQKAMRVTRERFGRVIHLFAPLYVSNECTNSCVYCGFNRTNDFKRTTLTTEEIVAEGRALWEMGFRNVLLVSGEHKGKASFEYLKEAVRKLSPRFPAVSVEVYPLSTEQYAELGEAGIEGVTVFQETYDPELYKRMHPAGKKAEFGWRLGTPERAGEAGLHRVGLGSLLGLGPWRFEAVALALHAAYLERRYWKTAVSVSFPRLRNAAGGFKVKHPVSDRELVQMACALRLLLPDLGMVLSTRESAEFRNGLAPICVTTMSAGARTEPGGYTKPGDAGEQFTISDTRSAAEVTKVLLDLGLEPVWKDWDATFYSKDAAG